MNDVPVPRSEPRPRSVFASRAKWVPVLAVALISCATMLPSLMGGSHRIRIPHERHRAAKVDCLACHESIFDATDFSQRNLPKEADCLKCHKEEKEFFSG